MYTFEPFFTYSPTISASRCQATMLCHSVRSCHWPSLSLKRSFVAIENFATAMPLGVYFTSGSLPRLPMRITLLTLFAMGDAPLYLCECPPGLRPCKPGCEMNGGCSGIGEPSITETLLYKLLAGKGW